MTVPAEYLEASPEFRAFLLDLRDIAGLSTTNQAFTVAEGVLLAFRHRLDTVQVARFADVLPPVLRAIFVTGWDPTAPPAPFGDGEAQTRDVQALRPLHNYAGDTSMRDVARALRRHVDEPRFDRVLATFGPAAVAFWTP
jgi:uncharacterized protein (DUF2267 family)